MKKTLTVCDWCDKPVTDPAATSGDNGIEFSLENLQFFVVTRVMVRPSPSPDCYPPQYRPCDICEDCMKMLHKTMAEESFKGRMFKAEPHGGVR